MCLLPPCAKFGAHPLHSAAWRSSSARGQRWTSSKAASESLEFVPTHTPENICINIWHITHVLINKSGSWLTMKASCFSLHWSQNILSSPWTWSLLKNAFSPASCEHDSKLTSFILHVGTSFLIKRSTVPRCRCDEASSSSLEARSKKRPRSRSSSHTWHMWSYESASPWISKHSRGSVKALVSDEWWFVLILISFKTIVPTLDASTLVRHRILSKYSAASRCLYTVVTKNTFHHFSVRVCSCGGTSQISTYHQWCPDLWWTGLFQPNPSLSLQTVFPGVCRWWLKHYRSICEKNNNTSVWPVNNIT